MKRILRIQNLFIKQIIFSFQITYKHKLRHNKLFNRKHDKVQNNVLPETLKKPTKPNSTDEQDLGIAGLFDSQLFHYESPTYRKFEVTLEPKEFEQQSSSIFLKYSVYGCLVLIYIKLNLLIIALIGAQSYPPGLFFLLICLGMIAPIAFKVGI